VKQDRFLLAILIGIAVIALAAVALFFGRRAGLAYGEEVTPAGVINNYALALYQGDFERAYGYLADTPEKPSFENFQQSITIQKQELSIVSLSIERVDLNGSQAIASLNLVRTGRLFTSLSREQQSGNLVLQPDGWKIISLPYPYFSWDWYQAAAKATAVPLP
jgi:hypothetical protein